MPRKLSETRIRILERLARREEGALRPDMHDIAADVGLAHATVSAAVWSMQERGQVANVGWTARRHPETHRWRDVRTWTITAAGREALAEGRPASSGDEP